MHNYNYTAALWTRSFLNIDTNMHVLRHSITPVTGKVGIYLVFSIFTIKVIWKLVWLCPSQKTQRIYLTTFFPAVSAELSPFLSVKMIYWTVPYCIELNLAWFNSKNRMNSFKMN